MITDRGSAASHPPRAAAAHEHTVHGTRQPTTQSPWLHRDTSKQAVELALAITLSVLHDIYRGKPSEAETRAVAAEIARAEAWAKPTEEETSEFLLRLVNGQPFAPWVPSENVFILLRVRGPHPVFLPAG
jgi:hypothetical protein